MEEKQKLAPEKTILAGLNTKLFSEEENATEESLQELEALLETAGGVCVGKPAISGRTRSTFFFG